MKKTYLILTIVISAISFNATASDKKYQLSVGSLPGVTGFEDFFLTDRVVSGEGPTSEQAFMNYSDSNSGAINPAISFAVKMNSEILGSTPYAEVMYAPGDAQLFQLSLNFEYNLFKPTSSSNIFITPIIGLAGVTQDMGVVPEFPGQINTADGDFNPGDEITMQATGFVTGIRAGYSLDLNSFSMFANIGFQFAMLDPKVKINDIELTGQIHAKSCTGASSVNLECENYSDDPFADVSGLSGVTFQIGAYF